VTAPVDPSQLSPGAIGMYEDHYVVALSPAKAVQDGQVVALSAAAGDTGFLGWIDPAATTRTALAAAQPGIAAPAGPAAVPAPQPPPIASATG
jgi:hypothetical protein